MASESTGKWIAEGEQFDGWKLRQVKERSVIVESGGRSHELTLQSRAASTADETRRPGRARNPAEAASLSARRLRQQLGQGLAPVVFGGLEVDSCRPSAHRDR